MTKLLAVYETREQLIAAAKNFDASADVYSGYDLEELSSISHEEPMDFAPIALIGAILGGCAGYFMQYYIAVKALPLNTGGRPIHTAIAFIPVTFECTVLGFALAAALAFFLSTKLPLLHHPLFGSSQFLMSRAAPFFLVVDESKAETLALTRPQRIERIES